MKIRSMTISSASLLTLATLMLFTATAAIAADGETRLSATSQGQGIPRGGLVDGAVVYDQHEALNTSGPRQKPRLANAQQKLSSVARATANVDFWFYEADVVLFSDFDNDGYYYGIDLLFDVDTVFSDADVYAVIYLSHNFGPWNEYAETEVFSIFGASADDQYVVETELLSGYVTGDYDLLIEIYDTYDGAFVASFGPDESSELSLLPLEDASRDAPQETIVVVSSGSGGGGAAAWLSLLMLLSVAVLRWTRPV